MPKRIEMKRLLIILFLCMSVTSMLMAGGQQESGEDEKIELSYTTWMTKGEDKPGIEAFMEANPNVIVRDEMLDGSKYAELMKTRILSGDVPDVMMIMDEQVKEYGREGYLADLSVSPAVSNLQSKVPSLMSYTERDGKIMALNVMGGRRGHQWYNKKLFTDLGLEVPKTLKDFEKVCEALLAAGKYPVLFGGSNIWTYDFAQIWGLADQVAVAHRLTGKYDLFEALYDGAKPSEIYGNTFRLFEKWVKAGYVVQASITTSWPESSQLFADGQVGIFANGPWVANLAEIKEANPAKFELGVYRMPAPLYQDKIWLEQTMNRFLAVSASSKHPESAMDLFNFLTSEDSLKKYLSDQSLTTLLPIEYELPPIMLEWNSLSSGPDIDSPPRAFPSTPGFKTNVSEGLMAIQAGQSVEDALAELDAIYAENKDNIKF